MWNFHVQLGSSWLTLVLVCLVAVGLPKIYQIIVDAQRNKQFEAELVSRHNCKDPIRLYYKWPLALDLLVEAFTADQAGAILGFFLSIIERTGTTFEQVLLGTRGIDTIDPKNLEAVLSTQFDEFGLGARSDNFRALLGHGIFTQDGAPWRSSRDLLKPQFMETRSKAFTDIQEEVERFIVKVRASSTALVDLQPLFFRLTLDTTMAVLFGRSLDSSEVRDRGDETAFAKAFDYAQHQLARRGRLGDLYWLINGKEFRRSCKAVHSFVDNIVAEALEETKSEVSGKGSPERYVFLKALISKTRDPIVLRDQLVNVLLAGRDTTACLLSWTLYVGQ
ncbi:hypothetical protein MMC30_005343 [Trapelia coarctata]|nr:hypothetical protein [Trapelia coarctata]